MTNRKKAAGGLVIILLISAMLCCIMAQIPQRVTAWAQTAASAWKFYNNRANANEAHEDDHSFDRNTKDENTYLDGENAVKAGTVASVLEYNYTYDKNTGKFGGELTRRENPATGAADPVLLASHCLHVEEVTGKVILVDEQGFAPAKRGEAAVDHFMEDRSYAQECYERLADVYRHATSVEVKEVYGYKNSHYMQPKGSHGVRPRLVVWPSTNAGGHMLVFHFADMPDIMYRIECGYQPINVDYMDVPDVPPVPDNPEPPTAPTPQVTPPPQVTPQVTPPPLEEKDLGQEYQSRNRNNSDTSGGSSQGGKNHNEAGVTDVKTPETTPETSSPDTYSAPDPPAEQSSSGSEEEASAGSGSGSVTADRDNGATETYTDAGGSSEATTYAGDGSDWGDFGEEVTNNAATVDPVANPAEGGNSEAGPSE